MVSAKIEFEGSKLAAALIKFQADLPDVNLDATNPHFNSRFASLPGITKVVLPKLAEHGLSFTAGGEYVDGHYGLSATLLHESGEERSGFFPIIATDPQKIGSAITYARRYLLASLTGIVADADDDGNAASLPTKAEATAATAQARVAKAQAAAKPVERVNGVGDNRVREVQEDVRANYIDTKKVTIAELNDEVKKYEAKGKNRAQAMEAVLADLKERFKEGK